MTAVEILLIIACALFVSGVIVSVAIGKKKRKNCCGCDCACCNKCNKSEDKK